MAYCLSLVVATTGYFAGAAITLWHIRQKKAERRKRRLLREVYRRHRSHFVEIQYWGS
jgi:hypothetical protein